MERLIVYLTALLAVGVGVLASPSFLGDACTSEIYCEGELLHTVQLADLFPDSKTFVDMKQRQSSTETLRLFNVMMNQTGGEPSRDVVEMFVHDNFDNATELEGWSLPDFTETPAVLATIVDPELRDWASDLNHLWKNLSRKMSDEVMTNQDQYSIIYVPNAFVVPGGRFLEFYYWDTYWIMRGILHCELFETAKGVLENFLSIVERFGFVPNGGRVYYLNRSQPPMLTPMVKSYVDITGDLEFFKTSAATLEKEYNFWMEHRTVVVTLDGVNYTMARYAVDSAAPRPESYREDYRLAQQLPVEKRDRFYEDIRSAAESGWDFSSRWFLNEQGTTADGLISIATQSIIPVDLNAFVYWNAVLLSELFTTAGDVDKAEFYRTEAETWLTAVTAVLWHDDLGTWLDYDMVNGVRREYFFPSNLAPLWTNCYDKTKKDHISAKVIAYLENSTALNYLGGLPTSLDHSGEQWDLPNAWPPLQHIIITGLDQLQVPEAQDLAFDLAQRWVHANYLGYQDKQLMYEKYDAITPGGYGGGGEYNVQAGFGWTNGVILDLLAKYGDRLQANENNPTTEPNTTNVPGKSSKTHQGEKKASGLPYAGYI